MKTILAFLLIFSTLPAAAQRPPRLIIRGDDMGFSHSGNLALIQCSKQGIQTSIEVIVPSPWFPEAVQLLKENPSIDVGVHLALSSEWDNIKWRPLSAAPSLRDSNGYFFPMIFPNKNYPRQSLRENSWQLEDIETEFRAQIELALKHIPRISHVSAHMGCTELSPEVRAMTKKLMKEYHIDIDLTEHSVSYAGYEGAHQSKEEKIESFIKMLDKLEAGKTYLFVEHPGLDDPELRAIHHTGYENVAADRQGVTALFTSDKVKAHIKKKGIQLLSYKELSDSK